MKEKFGEKERNVYFCHVFVLVLYERVVAKVLAGGANASWLVDFIVKGESSASLNTHVCS